MLEQVLDTVTAPVRATGRMIFGDKPCKVAVVGAAGGIGQPLSLLLKLSPFVTELSLYDVAPFTPGALNKLHEKCTSDCFTVSTVSPVARGRLTTRPPHGPGAPAARRLPAQTAPSKTPLPCLHCR